MPDASTKNADINAQKSRLKVLVEQRKEIYARADLSLDTSDLSIGAVVARIKAELGF